MRILGFLLKFLVLWIGLMLVAGGLVCSALGLGSPAYGFFAVIGLAAAGLGGLLVWAIARNPNRPKGAVKVAQDDAKDDLQQ